MQPLAPSNTAMAIDMPAIPPHAHPSSTTPPPINTADHTTLQHPKHAAQIAMLGRLQQRLLHLASVKLAALTQVAGMCDPQRQCAALQHTMALLEEVLMCHVELLVGRHVDQLIVAALFCVCEVWMMLGARRCFAFGWC